MATVTIVIADNPNGQIDFDVTFDPEWNENVKSTPAQNMAGWMLENAMNVMHGTVTHTSGPIESEDN